VSLTVRTTEDRSGPADRACGVPRRRMRGGSGPRSPIE
jgi:hypothetical protein